jgi:hypothetical protein
LFDEESKEELLRKDRLDKSLRIMNPLNRKTKQNARKYIYKISTPIIDGVFRDEYWTPVNALFSLWNAEDVFWEITKPSQYFNMHEPFGAMSPPYKQWYISISFYNDRANLNTLDGTLTAHFNGTREDPTKTYDLTLVI